MLDPDAPPELDQVCPSAAAFPTFVARWFADGKRESDTPHGFTSQLMLLPAVHEELRGALRRGVVESLIEYDIASTLPVLAHMERCGAWVHPPAGFLTWDHFADHTQDEIEHHEAKFLAIISSADPYAQSPSEAVHAFRREVRLLKQEEYVRESPDDELERMAESGFVPATALRRARRLVSMMNDWVGPLRSGNVTRMRGRMSLTRTGRWSAKQYPLHSLTKSGLEGMFMRSAMLPPPGFELVVADYSAFEARILAGLTDDPELMSVVHMRDFHTVLAARAQSASGVLSKEQWKAALYGIAYGQARKGFIREHPEMTLKVAGDAFDAVAKLLDVAMKYREKFKKKFQAGATPSVTLGGWRRRARRWTSGFNTVIQGQGADIFRWVLRTLHRELAPLGAFLVHQAHDEVFIASPPASTAQVVQLVKRVMENDVRSTSLMQRNVPLFAEVSVRKSWAK
ncbi:MAG: DNA polymerase [Polyangiaceae bacterium]